MRYYKKSGLLAGFFIVGYFLHSDIPRYHDNYGFRRMQSAPGHGYVPRDLKNLDFLRPQTVSRPGHVPRDLENLDFLRPQTVSRPVMYRGI